ncbi:MAG: hypothetical protein HY595_03870 [Candidatus Omnitrophica bacterium]|nr:hypothetical protein [Candidatus Omnitrophota bacterium]
MIEVVVVCGIIALLAAIIVPSLLRSRTTTNEAAAIGNLRALGVSIHVFQTQNNRFPSDWQADMYAGADPDFGPPSFDVSMAGSEVQGYLFTYAGQPAGCTNNCTGYTLMANPESLATLGTRAFFLDQDGRIRHCTGAGPADATDALITDPPLAC